MLYATCPFERAFLNHMGWSGNMCAPAPYVIDASEELIDRIAKDDMVRGVTIAAGGFLVRRDVSCVFRWQTRIRMIKLKQFEYKGYKITNFEMESSALAGLSRLMGHKAMTVCMVIANRLIKRPIPDIKIRLIKNNILFLMYSTYIISDR